MLHEKKLFFDSQMGAMEIFLLVSYMNYCIDTQCQISLGF